MIHLFLKAVLLISIPLFVLILLIHIQSTDNGNLHDFFLPKTCHAPCFMGIQPGVTTVSEAYALLAAHPWVEKVDIGPTQLSRATIIGPGLIHWTWSGAQPDWVDASRPGTLTTARGRVDYILIQTTIPLGAVTLALGAPGSQRVFASPESSVGASASYVTIYPESGLWISIGASCPLGPAFELWRQPVLIEWMSQPISNFNPSDHWPLFYQSC